MKIRILLLCFMSSVFYGCSSFYTGSTNNHGPMFNVYWKYNGENIDLSITNISIEPVLFCFPMSSEDNRCVEIEYHIYNNDADNCFKTYPSSNFCLPGNMYFKIIAGARNIDDSNALPSQDYDTIIPSLTKSFEKIQKIEVILSGIPLSKFVKINNIASFYAMRDQYRQKYSIDFAKEGYNKKEGILFWEGAPSPVDVQGVQQPQTDEKAK